MNTLYFVDLSLFSNLKTTVSPLWQQQNFEHNASVPTPPCNPTEPSDGTGEIEPSDGTGEIEPSTDRGRPVTVGEAKVSEGEEQIIELKSFGACDAGV